MFTAFNVVMYIFLKISCSFLIGQLPSVDIVTASKYFSWLWEWQTCCLQSCGGRSSAMCQHQVFVRCHWLANTSGSSVKTLSSGLMWSWGVIWWRRKDCRLYWIYQDLSRFKILTSVSLILLMRKKRTSEELCKDSEESSWDIVNSHTASWHR